jgi:hypothetical protein
MYVDCDNGRLACMLENICAAMKRIIPILLLCALSSCGQVTGAFDFLRFPA